MRFTKNPPVLRNAGPVHLAVEEMEGREQPSVFDPAGAAVAAVTPAEVVLPSVSIPVSMSGLAGVSEAVPTAAAALPSHSVAAPLAPAVPTVVEAPSPNVSAPRAEPIVCPPSDISPTPTDRAPARSEAPDAPTFASVASVGSGTGEAQTFTPPAGGGAIETVGPVVSDGGAAASLTAALFDPSSPAAAVVVTTFRAEERTDTRDDASGPRAGSNFPTGSAVAVVSAYEEVPAAEAAGGGVVLPAEDNPPASPRSGEELPPESLPSFAPLTLTPFTPATGEWVVGEITAGVTAPFPEAVPEETEGAGRTRNSPAAWRHCWRPAGTGHPGGTARRWGPRSRPPRGRDCSRRGTLVPRSRPREQHASGYDEGVWANFPTLEIDREGMR